jgi:hypothetical protein
MRESHLSKTCKVNHEATRSAFEAMFPLVDPRTRNPSYTGIFNWILVFGFYRLDDSNHGSLFASPAKVIFGMRKRVVDYLCEKIDRGEVYSEVENAIVETIVVCCDRSIILG